MLSVGIGYLDSHVVSTKFAIVIALLSSYCTMINPVIEWFEIVQYDDKRA